MPPWAVVRRMARDGTPSAEPADPPLSTQPTVLVEDDEAPAPGQLRKSEFLATVRPEIEQAVEAALADTSFSTERCPWIDRWFTYYRQRSARDVERAMRLYVGRAPEARTAEDYVPLVRDRVAQGVSTWREAGRAPVQPRAEGEAGTSASADRGRADVPVGPAAPTAPMGSGDGTQAMQSLGEGEPLAPSVTTRLGPALAQDLGAVRVHIGDDADQVVRGLDARAMTLGNHIAFARDEYAPGTPEGDALLAHELAHVAQQQSAPAALGPSAPASDRAAERDADLVAAGAVSRLWGRGMDMLAALRQSGQTAMRTGLRLARCSEEGAIPAVDRRMEYQQVVTTLRGLYARKQGVLEGTEPASELPAIDEAIQEQLEYLRDLGVQLNAEDVYQAVTAATPRDLHQVAGRLARRPTGPVSMGQRVTFDVLLDYIPSGRNVEVEWRWRGRDGQEYQFLSRPPRGRHRDVVLDEAFWNLLEGLTPSRDRGIEVVARVYLGDEQTPTTRVTSGWVPLDERVPGALTLVAEPPAVVSGQRVTVRPAEWVPLRSLYSIDWELDGRRVAQDLPVLTQTLTGAGSKRVTAKVYSVRRMLGIHDRRLAYEATTSIPVTDPQVAGEQLLGQMSPDLLPSLARTETSLQESIAELERRVAQGGEQQPYWRERLAAQRSRLTRLQEQAPAAARMVALPTNANLVRAGAVYAAPVPAVLVTPEDGGAQPLNVHVTLWSEAGTWRARLVDSTSAGVVKFDGDGPTPDAAYRDAFATWRADHPYPRGGTVRYRGAGWARAEAGQFETTTAWNTAKAWVDGILTVGGIVVAGLLLLAPEPTSTKWLGYVILAATVARSSVAIYENISIGIPPTDSRNVMEGLSIMTSFLGVGGTAMRSVGIRTVSPTVYRAGNYLVMTGLTGDIGTLVFATDEAITAIRSANADPTLDEGQRTAAILRTISGLMLRGALFFLSNRDLVRQGLRRSDFFRTDAARISRGAAGRGVPITLEPGARLDIAAELRAAGEPTVSERLRSGHLSDRELVDRHATLPWLRETLESAQVREMLERLNTDALVALGDVPARQAHLGLARINNTNVGNMLAPHVRGAGISALGDAIVASPGSRVTVSPVDPALVRINAELDIHRRRLAEIPPADRAELVRLYRSLEVAGSRNAMPAADRQALDRITGSGGHRLRSEYHRARADAWVDELGIRQRRGPGGERLFQNVTAADRDRLYDLVGERPPGAAPQLRQQAAEYALARARTVREFVEHYQVYVQEFYGRARPLIATYDAAFQAEVARVQAAQGGAPLTARQTQAAHNAVRGRMGIAGRPDDFYYRQVMVDMATGGAPGAGVIPTRPSPATVAQVEAAYQARVNALAGRIGGVQIEAGLPPAETIRRLQGVDVSFSSDSAAAYHVAKHHQEILAGEQAAAGSPPGADATAYMNSAQTTIRNPTVPPEHRSDQFGRGRSYYFTREVGGQRLRAIVFVGDDGRAVLATYMAVP